MHLLISVGQVFPAKGSCPISPNPVAFLDPSQGTEHFFNGNSFIAFFPTQTHPARTETRKPHGGFSQTSPVKTLLKHPLFHGFLHLLHPGPCGVQLQKTSGLPEKQEEVWKRFPIFFSEHMCVQHQGPLRPMVDLDLHGAQAHRKQ